MNQPLNQYYIKSSNCRLSPENATEEYCKMKYRQFLNSGYRHIEIDCWDGPDGDPIIFNSNYGAYIKVESIIKVIANEAFETNQYPLFLSLNVQCSEEQQEQLAKIIQSNLVTLLYFWPENQSILPSPEFLQNKILIHSYGNFESAGSEQIDYNYKKQKDYDKYGSKEITNVSLIKLLSFYNKKIDFEPKKSSKLQIFDLNLVSFKKLTKLLENKEAQLIKFHKQYLTKVSQPKHSGQKNFNPFEGFLSGAQIITIDSELKDFEYYYYESKFLENGGNYSGYMLKPYFMLSQHQSIVCPSLDFQFVQFEVMITIISAHQIITPEQESKVSSYSLQITVISARDDLNTKFTTPSIMSDGFKVDFQYFIAKFPICCPEMNTIIFQLKEENNLRGVYGIPSQCLKSGYRVIPLRDPQTFEILENSSIFCYILLENK